MVLRRGEPAPRRRAAGARAELGGRAGRPSGRGAALRQHLRDHRHARAAFARRRPRRRSRRSARRSPTRCRRRRPASSPARARGRSSRKRGAPACPCSTRTSWIACSPSGSWLGRLREHRDEAVLCAPRRPRVDRIAVVDDGEGVAPVHVARERRRRRASSPSSRAPDRACAAGAGAPRACPLDRPPPVRRRTAS